MQTTSQILYDGVGNVTMHFTGLSEGDNETLALKVDCSVLQPPCRSVKIMDMEYEISGGLVELFWDALDPVKFQELAKHGTFEHYRINGRVNPTMNAGGTGNILLSTIGFDIGSTYSIKLEMKKKF